MNQFLIGLVERTMMRAPVLERRARSLFEPNAPTAAGPAALESDDPMSEVLDEHLGSPTHPPASRAARQATREGEPAEQARHSDASSTAGAPHRTARAGSASDAPPRAMVAALDGGAPDPDVKPEVSVSIAMDRPHAPSPVFAAPIARRDLEPGGRLLPALAIAPPVQPRGDRGAETQLPSTGRSRRHAPALAGEPSRELPRAPAVPVASPDPATIVQALAAHAGAPATGALLRSGPRVPGPPALLVQSQRPADLSRSGGISAAAPPPVHVTIGRVEVRANASGAERPPARRAAGPKLTLEDYLHGRRGSR